MKRVLFIIISFFLVPSSVLSITPDELYSNDAKFGDLEIYVRNKSDKIEKKYVAVNKLRVNVEFYHIDKRVTYVIKRYHKLNTEIGYVVFFFDKSNNCVSYEAMGLGIPETRTLRMIDGELIYYSSKNDCEIIPMTPGMKQDVINNAKKELAEILTHFPEYKCLITW